jgi:hypothetical protein
VFGSDKHSATDKSVLVLNSMLFGSASYVVQFVLEQHRGSWSPRHGKTLSFVVTNSTYAVFLVVCDPSVNELWAN